MLADLFAQSPQGGNAFVLTAEGRLLCAARDVAGAEKLAFSRRHYSC